MNTAVAIWFFALLPAAALRFDTRRQTTNLSAHVLESDQALNVSAALSNKDGVMWPSSPRMIVVAGLEGTGHHFFKAFFNKCPNLKMFQFSHWNQIAMEAHHHPSGWPPGMSGASTDELTKFVEQNPQRTFGLHPFSTSWPNGHGTHSQRMYEMQPDLTLLREVAESAKVGLRVIVMRRDFKSVLKSTCVHRTDLEPCSPMAETLAENLKDLSRQLRTLDPATYSCINYGETSDLESKLEAALKGSAGLGISVHDAIAQSWRPGAGLSHGYEMQDALPEHYDNDVRTFATLMEKPLRELDALCHAAAFA